jgi:hypothetical protein
MVDTYLGNDVGWVFVTDQSVADSYFGHEIPP